MQTLQPWPSADPVVPAGAMDKEQQFLEGEGKGRETAFFPGKSRDKETTTLGGNAVCVRLG